MTNLSFALQTIRQFVERNAVEVGRNQCGHHHLLKELKMIYRV